MKSLLIIALVVALAVVVGRGAARQARPAPAADDDGPRSVPIGRGPSEIRLRALEAITSALRARLDRIDRIDINLP